QVYAWLWAANRPGDSLALQHPDWYAVNRIGKSCHAPQDRPFVEYYQFLCPNSRGHAPTCWQRWTNLPPCPESSAYN
ncbi:MAG: hypothetical protein IKK15_06500, partial [Akkermansia sp.]|nr:hypothetical protein [Akkermansia sp.]